VIIVAVLAVYTVVKERKIEAGTAIAEELQENFVLWQNGDEDKRSELESGINDQIENITSDFSGTFAHQRALMIEGNMAWEKEQWDDAVLAFEEISRRYPKSYLAPVALMNQAATLEESGKGKEAVEVYQKVVENYSSVSPDAPRALFSIARLYETTGQEEAAFGAYQEVIDTFPDSDWTKLARDRIIYLETR
jgi:tetratricopeptide (TPR) repeat protein